MNSPIPHKVFKYYEQDALTQIVFYCGQRYSITTLTLYLRSGLNIFRNNFPGNIFIINTIFINNSTAYCWLNLFDDNVIVIDSESESDSGVDSEY